MSHKFVFDSSEAVIDVLWSITFGVLVARVAFFYAVLAAAAVLASFAALAVGHAAGHAVLPSVFSSSSAAAQSRRTSMLNTLFCEIRGKTAARAARDVSQHVGEPELVHPIATATATATATAHHVAMVSSGPVMTAVLVASTVLSVAACCHLLMDYAKIPRSRVFRLAIGAAGAVYAAGAWLVAHLVTAHNGVGGGGGAHVPLFEGKTVDVVGAAFVASVAIMPWLSMEVLEQQRARRSQHRRAVSSIERVSSASVPEYATESEDELAASGSEKTRTRAYQEKPGNDHLLHEQSSATKRYDLRRNPRKSEKIVLI